MAAGYSGRSAAEKLGVKPGSRLGLVAADDGWTLDGLPEDVEVTTHLASPRDVTVAFVRSRAELVREADRLADHLDDRAALWIAWPRRAAGHDSDVPENLLRDELLPRGLVDVKVAAVDENWSGLKFVRRKELRAR